MANRSWTATGLALVASLAGAQTPLAPETLFEQVSPSVWVVRTFDASQRPLRQGSAVVIAPGRLITNCHVLRQARSLTVGRENVSYGATLEHPDTERDLCQVQVANFSAPAVAIAPADSLRVGARVYAIGAPRGLETTLSDGLISGLRRNEQGALDAVQITVPLSGGSSGGGLFDIQGRLVGITTFGLRDSQNLNFALPANWIAEVPARAQAAVAARQAPAAAGGTATAAAPKGDRVFEYRLRDGLTGNTQNVVYRLERVDGDQMIFNQGTRIERAGGHVVENKQPLGGEFDLAMPPGGWVNGTPEIGATWPLNYERRTGINPIQMELRARVADKSTMRVASRDIEVMQVRFDGYTTRNLAFPSARGTVSYTAYAWYAPSLGRVVRFEARTRGASIRIDESLELIDIRSE